ncbi:MULTISPECIES: 2-amino-4-hydroxy-6-hydroxymethyldihydropteridine diphosphokinase [unclassified Sphingomonas]|jgi:2-amino-4-hydroxy-6-hydroxymethyldihydropteridine diphosphokinase|uniref:2-amino-4-hydroxy-6- hydroxymethyldihydropteridine diphosphokinase n=1 Tax=unclassified Sphingomonas TaxID=196159 RepID=UPI000E10B129|nr:MULTISPECIES: 2-amino-4-hydroxy-6-hydroxymethyldihydropteridine diphosphokinase [unclassified Sphingomonas]AXJ95433.1 2-amino-4-hydroxy-6-hydroxymethyldihydropteridine diphosphokinase [Sphingomonas sp. FARSPH]
MATTIYAIGLGSNRRGRHGGPAAEVRAALAALGDVIAASPIVATPPLGPSIRRFANAAALIESAETPPHLLARLKRIEAAFGRRRGRRWGARVIDLDILLWSGGRWRDARLTVPHVALAQRAFVIVPLVRIAPGWRDPVSGRTIRQLAARIDAPRPRRKD